MHAPIVRGTGAHAARFRCSRSARQKTQINKSASATRGPRPVGLFVPARLVIHGSLVPACLAALPRASAFTKTSASCSSPFPTYPFTRLLAKQRKEKKNARAHTHANAAWRGGSSYSLVFGPTTFRPIKFCALRSSILPSKSRTRLAQTNSKAATGRRLNLNPSTQPPGYFYYF